MDPTTESLALCLEKAYIVILGVVGEAAGSGIF